MPQRTLVTIELVDFTSPEHALSASFCGDTSVTVHRFSRAHISTHSSASENIAGIYLLLNTIQRSVYFGIGSPADLFSSHGANTARPHPKTNTAFWNNWDIAMVITTQAGSLDVRHSLIYALEQQINDAGRWSIVGETTSDTHTSKEGKRVAMGYLEDTLALISTLGVYLDNPLIKTATLQEPTEHQPTKANVPGTPQSKDSDTKAINSQAASNLSSADPAPSKIVEPLIFHFNHAHGYPVRQASNSRALGFIVKKESEIAPRTKRDCPESIIADRDYLISRHIVDNNIFVYDCWFSSPAKAAQVIAGGSEGNQQSWTRGGNAIKDFIQEGVALPTHGFEAENGIFPIMNSAQPKQNASNTQAQQQTSSAQDATKVRLKQQGSDSRRANNAQSAQRRDTSRNTQQGASQAKQQRGTSQSTQRRDVTQGTQRRNNTQQEGSSRRIQNSQNTANQPTYFFIKNTKKKGCMAWGYVVQPAENKKSCRFTVCRGSKLAAIEAKHFGDESCKAPSKLYGELVKTGVIRNNEFTCDYTFSSISIAAAVVRKASSNGWNEWCDADGNPLSSYREREDIPFWNGEQ